MPSGDTDSPLCLWVAQRSYSWIREESDAFAKSKELEVGVTCRLCCASYFVHKFSLVPALRSSHGDRGGRDGPCRLMQTTEMCLISSRDLSVVMSFSIDQKETDELRPSIYYLSMTSLSSGLETHRMRIQFRPQNLWGPEDSAAHQVNAVLIPR